FSGLGAALTFAALLGPAVALVLLLMPAPRVSEHAYARRAFPTTVSKLGLLTPTVLSLTGFFVLLALSNGALQDFGVVSLMATQGLTLSSANMALTAYLFF